MSLTPRCTIESQTAAKLESEPRTTGSTRELEPAQTNATALAEGQVQNLPLHTDPLLYLQRTVGNRAVQSAFRPRLLQPKLTIGAPTNVDEEEADQVDAPETPSTAVELLKAGVAGSDGDGSKNDRPKNAAARQFAPGSGLPRVPLATLQRLIGNRALARLLSSEVSPISAALAAPELRRKCSCGGSSDKVCSECRANRLARRLSANGDTGVDAGTYQGGRVNIANRGGRSASSVGHPNRSCICTCASPSSTCSRCWFGGYRLYRRARRSRTGKQSTRRRAGRHHTSSGC